MNIPPLSPSRPLRLAPPLPDTQGIHRLFRGLLELCFPPSCLACGANARLPADLLLCPACAASLDFVREPCCPGCGLVHPYAVAGNHLCGDCLAGAFAFSRARSVLRYKDAAASLIRSFKYGKKHWALRTLVSLTRRAPGLAELGEPDLIVPVPLHPSRLRERGFNQALLLARVLFSHWRQRIAVQALARVRQAPAQASLSGSARRERIRGAFEVRRPEMVRGQRVLLVDDVMTTGATANECAKVLRRTGASTVEVFTFARVWDD